MEGLSFERQEIIGRAEADFEEGVLDIIPNGEIINEMREVLNREFTRYEAKEVKNFGIILGILNDNIELARRGLEQMRGGGRLFGLTQEGSLLFKDRGMSPVFSGQTLEGEYIFGLTDEQKDLIVHPANAWEISDTVRKQGFELLSVNDESLIVAMDIVEGEVLLSKKGSIIMHGKWRDDTSDQYVPLQLQNLGFPKPSLAQMHPAVPNPNMGVMRILEVG